MGLKTYFFGGLTMSVCAPEDGILLVWRPHFAGLRMSIVGPNAVILRVESCHFAGLKTAILQV